MRVTLTFVLVASESCFVVIVAGILVALFSGGIHPGEPALAGGTADPPPPSPVGAAQLPAVAPIAMPVSTPSISTGRPPIPTPSLTSTPVLTRSPSQPPVVVLSHCGPITASGTYEVDSDLIARGDCLTIAASDVILDCLGHSLLGTNKNGYGIVIRKYGFMKLSVPVNIEIRDCRLSNFSYGIYAESGRNLSIHDNSSSGNYDDVQSESRYGRFLGMTEGGGIRLNYTSDSVSYGNTTDDQGIGIDVRTSSNVKVSSNTASHNSAWGINIMQTVNSRILANTASDNVGECTWGAGVVGFGCDAGGIMLQDGSNGNVVGWNTVTGNNGNGIFIKAHAVPCGNDNSITGNTVEGALYNSIELGFCTGNKVSDNTVSNSLDGVFLVFAHQNEISNNTIVNMRSHGITSPNGHDNIISGNHVAKSNEGLYVYSTDYDGTNFAWLPTGDYSSHDYCLCGNKFDFDRVALHFRIRPTTVSREISSRMTNGRLSRRGIQKGMI